MFNPTFNRQLVALNNHLGSPQVAVIAGGNTHRTDVIRWMTRAIHPTDDILKRIGFAYEILQDISKLPGGTAASRAWFVSGVVGDDAVTPIIAISTDRFDEVRTSLRSYLRGTAH